jgi:iron complex transport system ATP-binding protein
MTGAPFVQFIDAELGYPNRAILTDVNLSLAEGDFLGIVGPNGAGKTTLLRTLLGIIPPRSGKRLTPRHAVPRFGYVPQREALDAIFPFTVREVVSMGRFARVGVLGRFAKVDQDRIAWSLERAGIPNLADRPYRELSGGQRQRALIARALTSEPEILVLDEPTAGMDLRGAKLIMDLVADLHTEGHLTVVLVTHALGEVANAARTIAVVEHGRAAVGGVDEVLTSATLTRMYDMPVVVETVAGQRVIVPLNDAILASKPVQEWGNEDA